MKKLTLLALVFAMCLSVTACGNDDKDTDSTGTGVSSIPGFIPSTETMGKVEYPSEEELGIIYDEEGIAYKAEFDDKGRVTSRTCIDGDSGLYGTKTEYTYDLAGHVATETEYDAYGRCLYKNIYAYHANGEKKTIVVMDRNSKLSAETEYDESGNMLKSVIYDVGEGNTVVVKDMVEKTYSTDGKLIREKFTHTSIGIFEENQYDMSGNKVKNIKYNADGVITGVTEYVYAEDGKLVEEKISGADGVLVESYKYEYDEAGRKHRRLHYNGYGVIQDQEVYTYNAEGILEKTTKYDPNGYEI